jgi:hypothetical protein
MDTLNPEYLFRQTAAQVRRHGARGGRATARNRRLRPAAVPSARPAVQRSSAETTARAITALDTQFPWLSGCEKRARS